MVMLSRVTGFFRGTLLAYYFGQNRMTDAYSYAFTIPDVLWSLVAGGALYASFVPVITEYFSHDDEEGAWKTFSVVFTFISLVLAVVLPLLWIFARPLLHIFAPDLSRPQPLHPALAAGTWVVSLRGHPVLVRPMDLAVTLTRIVIPAQLCFFLGSLLMGCQHSLKRFTIPAMGPVIYNLGIIVGGFAGQMFPRYFGGMKNGYGIAGFAWGALVGAFIGSIVIQVWAIQGIRPKFRPSLNLRFKGAKKCGKLVLPVLLGVSLPQVDQIINGFYVSGLAGGRSILDYTNRLMQLPLGIFGQAIGMVILPTLSQHAAQKDTRQFKDMISFGIRLALFLTVPAAALMVVLAAPLIHVVYQHGNFQASNTSAAVPALIYYAIGVPAWSAQAVIARGFYALQDTWTPVIVGTLVTIIFFILNGQLVHRMQTPGAALATTIAATLHATCLYVLLSRRIGGVNKRELVFSCRRIVVGALLMLGAAYGVSALIPYALSRTLGGSILELVLASAIGGAVYLGFQLLMGSDEIRRFKSMMRRRPPVVEGVDTGE